MFTQCTTLIGHARVIVQYITLAIVVTLACLASLWSVGALLGFFPWLRLVETDALGGIDAGIALQSVLTLLLLGLCFFLPTNARVMRLETSHRRFGVTMQDVARAYHAAHAADRNGVFALKSEFDSVRERLIHLRNHPDLDELEPEVLELAAQMSHESRDLAAIYADERVARAREFLRQRQDEAMQFQERVQIAHATCHELRRWLEKVEIEESIGRAQLERLTGDLAEILPAIGLDLRAQEPQAQAQANAYGDLRSVAAE